MCPSKGNARPTVPHQRHVPSGREPLCGELRAALPRGREPAQAPWSPEWGWGCGRRSRSSCKKGVFTRQTGALASQGGTVCPVAQRWDLSGRWRLGLEPGLQERRTRVRPGSGGRGPASHWRSPEHQCRHRGGGHLSVPPPLLSSGETLTNRVEYVDTGRHLNCQVHRVGLAGRQLRIQCSGRWKCWGFRGRKMDRGGVITVWNAAETWEPVERLLCGPGRGHRRDCICGFIKRREMGFLWRSRGWVLGSPPGLTPLSPSFPL